MRQPVALHRLGAWVARRAPSGRLVRRASPRLMRGLTMPFKSNADRRHHIPKQQHRVTNWAAYEAGLRARGSLTVWFTPEAVEAWRAEPRTRRGGTPRHSGPAIPTTLKPRALFPLALAP